MPIDTSGLSRAFKKLGEQFETRDPVYRAVIVSDDGDGYWTVDFSNPDLTTGARRQVRGAGNYWEGLPVRVSIDRKVWGPNEWVIMGADSTAYPVGYDDDHPPISVALHGWTHGFYQPDEVTNLNTFQLYSLRVQPADPEDQTVDVNPGIYYISGTFYYLSATSNVDLSAYIAALVVGQRQYLVLSIDSSQTINVTQGTPVVGALSASDIPTPPTDERALCAVDIRNGDTALTRDRVYADLRFLAGGGPSSNTYAIALFSGGVTEYAVSDAGMAAAIAAAASGDTIWIPPVNLSNDYIVPAGVTVKGQSISDVVFAGQIELEFRRQDADNKWRVTIDSSGDIGLDEVVSATPTQHDTSAGVVSNGEVVTVITSGTTIKVYEQNVLRITYSSASNFQTETAGELKTLGTGGAVTNNRTFPYTLSGLALDSLTEVAA